MGAIPIEKGRVFRGALLIAGTSIGGGMLALPVLTSQGGFIPSIFIYFFCWLFMAATGVLMAEVCQWMEGETNLVSMAEKTLGRAGKWAAWGLYLFLFYSLTLAYIVGCGNLISDLLPDPIPRWIGSMLFVGVAGPLLYAGPRVVGRLNVFFMLGLGICYVTFVIFGAPHVDDTLLLERNWTLSLMALPIAFTSFAYQGIVPTLSTYLHRDALKTRLAIVIGSAIPLVAYLIWQWLILGIVPTYAPGGLYDALQEGKNAITPLKYFIQNPAIVWIGEFFAFFALITSFFGVTLGLLDFLADGLKVEKDAKGRLLLCTIIFVPPLLISFSFHNVFLIALHYAGGFGVALLLGLLPILMVWVGRYRIKIQAKQLLPGGRGVLSILILFVVFELVCEFFF